MKDAAPISAPESSKEVSLRHLDFETVETVALERIALPISLADRKKVGAWAVILSELSDAERRACARVSKLIRYAGELLRVLCMIPIFFLMHAPYAF
jgi:hypothetical protein